MRARSRAARPRRSARRRAASSTRRGSPRDRGHHAPRRDRVPDARRGARGRAGALAASRDDVLGRARHGARDPDRLRARRDPQGHRRADARVARSRARAREDPDDRPLARHPRRADPPGKFTFARWYAEVVRARTRIVLARDQIAVGKIAGAVGVYTGTSIRRSKQEARSRRSACAPSTVATQIVARDRHAGGVLRARDARRHGDRAVIALGVRHWQRTEVGRRRGMVSGRARRALPRCRTRRTRSSSENLCGLARLLRGYATTALEDVALWHERDISHSSVERVAMPDATTLADFMTVRCTSLVTGLVVHANRMKSNLDRTGGLYFSEAVLLALVKSGMPRQAAYVMVQRLGGLAWTIAESAAVGETGAKPGRFRRAARRGSRGRARTPPRSMASTTSSTTCATRSRSSCARSKTAHGLCDEPPRRSVARAKLRGTLDATPWTTIGGVAMERYDGKGARLAPSTSARGERIIVVTDRLSAFDAVVGTIPSRRGRC